MRNLLAAYFSRLRRDKAFWGFSAAMLLAAVAVVISGVRVDLKYPTEPLYTEAEELLFNSAPYLGIFCSVVISLFLGTEYSDGALRNKLIAGRTRCQIYGGSLASSVAIAETVALFWFLGGLTGLVYFRRFSLGAGRLLFYLLLVLLSTAALASVFTLAGMLVSNRTVSVVLCIFLALGLMLLGSFFYNALGEPETIVSNIIISAENGVEFGDPIPNPAYVGGPLRKVYQAILNILPTGQTILLANYNDPEPLDMPALEVVGSCLVTVLTNIAGLLAFRRKDVK